MKLENFFQDKHGVTLIELMVAFGVFGIFISIALGGFMQALKNQRAALVFMETNDAASIIFEDIVRQLRTAKIDSIVGGNQISFTNYKGAPYSFSPGGVISNSISVYKFVADVRPSTTKGAPPRIVMSITMKISDPSIGGDAYKTLQTTVSPRIYYNLKDVQL
jgi:prepilin-type N-terminal cleavage/methylation domain-containing protein